MVFAYRTIKGRWVCCSRSESVYRWQFIPLLMPRLVNGNRWREEKEQKKGKKRCESRNDRTRETRQRQNERGQGLKEKSRLFDNKRRRKSAGNGSLAREETGAVEQLLALVQDSRQ